MTVMGKKTSPFPYTQRDVSWMYFNRRILQEAMRPEVPLLERLSFLGIYSNNLDEFFRVRVASLNRVIEWSDKVARKGATHSGGASVAKEAQLAKRTAKEISRLNSTYSKEYEMAVESVYKELSDNNICLITDKDADADQLKFIRKFFHDKLEGHIVPVWFSAVKHLDYETDEDIYLAVKAGRLSNRIVDGERRTVYDYAYFDLPVQSCGRFIRLPDKDGKCYIMYLDDVVRCSLSEIFEGMGYVSTEAYAFKFTRDAEMDIDEDKHNGLLQKIAKGLKNRRKGEPLRFVYDSSMPSDLLRRVMGKLDLDRKDTVLQGGRYQNHKDLMKFPDCGRKDLKFIPYIPIIPHSLDGNESLIDRVRAQDRFLHVPYHSFAPFVRLLHEAAVDRRVSSVKITLYRLAKDSRVVNALIGAARNGKKVTVVIELLARFDEESNMKWAQKMQDAGIKVIFGVEGLKVHSKVVHIGMKSGSDIACVSTGNFHEGNAATYTDCILMTASRRITADVDTLFDFIEKPYIPVQFKELLVSPNEMKKKFISLINNEIKNHKNGRPAYIKVKINHITHPDIVSKLYEAACSGVKVDLLVRGNCSLVTAELPEGVPMHVAGIIDRYLEHSRIFVFAAGGQEKVFIGSADWMPRNLDNRIEVIAPVYDPTVKQEMIRIVDYGLRDARQARVVDGHGSLEFASPDNPLSSGSQEALYAYYRSCEPASEDNAK